MSRRFALTGWVVALLVGLSACAPAAPATPISPSAAPSTPLPPVVARVNGVEISRAAFEQQRARLLPPGSASDPAFDEAILNSLIEQVLFEQAAAELGVSVTDAQLDDELAAMRAQAEQATPGGWVAWLSANGYAEADLREAVRSSLLAARVRDAVLADAGEVETVRAVRARHILLPTFEEAEAAKVRLQNGEPFDQVALALSRDVSTRASGGDLGFFVREDLTTPELADLAFALEPGQMAGPIQTVLGWHLVETLGFEERPVTDDGRAAAQETVFAAWLSARKAAATIERF